MKLRLLTLFILLSLGAQAQRTWTSFGANGVQRSTTVPPSSAPDTLFRSNGGASGFVYWRSDWYENQRLADSVASIEDARYLKNFLNDLTLKNTGADSLLTILTWGNSIFGREYQAEMSEGSNTVYAPPGMYRNDIARKIYDTYQIAGSDLKYFPVKNMTGFITQGSGFPPENSFTTLSGTWAEYVDNDYNYYRETSTTSSYIQIATDAGVTNASLIANRSSTASTNITVLVSVNGGAFVTPTTAGLVGGDSFSLYKPISTYSTDSQRFFRQTWTGLNPANTYTFRFTMVASGIMRIWGMETWERKSLRVINAARGGNTMQALSAHIDDDILSTNYAADVAFFELTMLNDSFVNNITSTESYLESVLSKLKASGLPIVIIIPHKETVETAQYPSFIRIAREAARKYGFPIIDMYAKWVAGNLSGVADGTHLNDAGVGYYTAEIFKVLSGNPQINYFPSVTTGKFAYGSDGNLSGSTYAGYDATTGKTTFNPTYTSTTSISRGMEVSPVITSRATSGDLMTGLLVRPTYTAGANGQTFTGLVVDMGLTVGAFTGSLVTPLLVSTSTTAASINSFQNNGAGSNSIQLVAGAGSATWSRNNGANGSTTISNLGTGNINILPGGTQRTQFLSTGDVAVGMALSADPVSARLHVRGIGSTSSTYNFLLEKQDGTDIMRGRDDGNVSLELQTASRALVTDASKNIVSSSTTSTEIGYVSGVTSSIQTQLNAKADASSILTMASGTYTPTITGVTNVASSGAVVSHYIRVGNQVTVYGSLTFEPTSINVLTELGISLPIASNIGATTDVSGVGSGDTGGVVTRPTVLGDVSNDRGTISFISSNTVSTQNVFFTFTYTVI